MGAGFRTAAALWQRPRLRPSSPVLERQLALCFFRTAVALWQRGLLRVSVRADNRRRISLCPRPRLGSVVLERRPALFFLRIAAALRQRGLLRVSVRADTLLPSSAWASGFAAGLAAAAADVIVGNGFGFAGRCQPTR